MALATGSPASRRPQRTSLSYQKRKRWRDGWLSFRRRPTPYKRERYCEKCDRLYDENHNPPTDEKLVAGSIAGLVYLTKNWGRERRVVKFGRWQAHGDKLVLSQLLSREDLDDLLQVVAQARDYLDAQEAERKRRRRREGSPEVVSGGSRPGDSARRTAARNGSR